MECAAPTTLLFPDPKPPAPPSFKLLLIVTRFLFLICSSSAALRTSSETKPTCSWCPTGTKESGSAEVSLTLLNISTSETKSHKAFADSLIGNPRSTEPPLIRWILAMRDFESFIVIKTVLYSRRGLMWGFRIQTLFAAF